MSQASTLFQLALVHLTLTAAPAVAAILCTARFGRRDVPTLLCVGLAASGVSAMVILWSYFADPTFGQVMSFLLIAGSAIATALALRNLRGRVRELSGLVAPFLFWGLAVLFLLYLGFLHGGTKNAILSASVRFSKQLPSDSYLPLSFANWIYKHGNQGTAPHIASWLGSDRPPLQSGYVLAQRPFGWDKTFLHYQILSVGLQQLWVLGLWALLTAARVRRATRGFVMVAVLVSDVAIVHGFYVWPKLLAAAFLLGAAALVLSEQWRRPHGRAPLVLLVACLLGLGLLAHGSSVFGVVPILLVGAYRGVPNRRLIGAGLLIGVVLWAPWAAYQHWVDPPGNRLPKWMLAGVTKIDKRGTVDTIVHSYESAGVGRVLENKGANFRSMTGDLTTLDHLGDAVTSVASGNPDRAIRELRSDRFFSLLWSCGFFIVAPFVMLWAYATRRRRDPTDWAFAVVAFLIVGVGCLVWGLVLFGNSQSRTVVHQGTLMIPVLALAGAVAGLRAVAPRTAAAIVVLNTAFVLALYAPTLDEYPDTRFSYVGAAAGLVCLAGCIAVAVASTYPQRFTRHRDEPGPGPVPLVEPVSRSTAGSTAAG